MGTLGAPLSSHATGSSTSFASIVNPPLPNYTLPLRANGFLLTHATASKLHAKP